MVIFQFFKKEKKKNKAIKDISLSLEIYTEKKLIDIREFYVRLRYMYNISSRILSGYHPDTWSLLEIIRHPDAIPLIRTRVISRVGVERNVNNSVMTCSFSILKSRLFPWQLCDKKTRVYTGRHYSLLVVRSIGGLNPSRRDLTLAQAATFLRCHCDALSIFARSSSLI